MSTVKAGTMRPILGPLPCVACGRLVVWATYTAVIPEPRRRESHVRTRALLGWDGLERHSCGRAS